jgi:cobalt-zinc-cadmium efflux system membrane fusion protein
MKSPGVENFLAFALLALAQACRSSQAATESTVLASDEIRLSADEVAHAGIEIVAAEEHDLDDVVLSTGRVTVDDRRVGHVFSPVTGRVVRILASTGEHVKKGVPLATIESPDIGDAVSDRDKSKADLIAAQHDYERQKALFQEGAAAAATLERSEDGWRKARAAAEQTHLKTSLLGASGVDAVSQTYTLVAPIEGEVWSRDISPGVEVQGSYGGGTPRELFVVGDARRVWVVGNLYEADLPRVHLGASVTVTVLAHPGRSFSGAVAWVSATFDPDTHTARVRCELDNADGALRPEMYAMMHVRADPERGLAIPRRAVIKLGEFPIIFVRRSVANQRWRFIRSPVDVEESGTGEWVRVRHGVSAGDEVVVRGGATLMQRL